MEENTVLNLIPDEEFGSAKNFISTITEGFMESAKSDISKYFYLYFIYLMGHLQYREEGEECIFYNETENFRVPLPVIDSEEKYQELQKTNQDLENIYEKLKKKP